MTSKPKSRYSLTCSYRYIISRLKLCNLLTQLLKRFHQTYECYVTFTSSLACLIYNRLETTHYLRSIYMPTAKSTTYPTTRESSQKTQSTLYKDPQHPTTDELYYVLLHNISYVDLNSICTSSSVCNNLGSCDGCPFTDISIEYCFLSNYFMLPAVDKLRQTHPELFI